MPVERYLRSNDTTGIFEDIQPLIQSSGIADGGRVVGTDPATGQLHPSVVPASAGGGAIVETIITTEALAAGAFVDIYPVSGNRRLRNALAADETKRGKAYVKQAYNVGDTATVYKNGVNDAIPLGSFTTADIGKYVFLSSTVAGAVVTTPPTATGSIKQHLGEVIDVGSTTIRVAFAPGVPIKRL